MSQARFQKMQREKARREKAAEKKERKALRADEAAALEAAGGAAPQPDQNDVLAELAALHEQFDKGTIEFEEFEERKSELLGRLAV